MTCRPFEASWRHIIRCSSSTASHASRTLLHLPFLFQTCTIQRRRVHRSSNTNNRSALRPRTPKKNSSRNRNDDLPFVYKRRVVPPRQGTITRMERAAFARLFDKLVKANAKTTTKAGQRKQETFDEGELLADLKAEEHEVQEYDYELDRILSEALDSKSEAIEQLPVDLQHMATEAHMEIARDERQHERIKDAAAAGRGNESLAHDSIEQERSAALNALERRLISAKTDIELWNILETELFEKIRQLDFDRDRGKEEAMDSEETDGLMDQEDATSNQREEASVLRFYGQAFPGILVLAMRILTQRAHHSSLADALLPTLKSLGNSAYVWGITSSLYNDLLLYQWRVHNKYGLLLQTLKEMDSTSLKLGESTLRILIDIGDYRASALRGAFGESVKRIESMSKRMREGQELEEWQAKIRSRMEEDAMESARRVQAERLARQEGAFAEEELDMRIRRQEGAFAEEELDVRIRKVRTS